MGYQPGNTTNESSPHVISKKEEILDFFYKSYKKPEDVVIGMEVENHGIHKSNHKSITYLEQNGMRKIQEKLISELDWKIDRQEGKYITSMSRGGTHLNLEMSEAMCELSGRTHPSIHDLAREMRIHQHEVTEISNLFGVTWLGIGHEPFAKKDEARIVPIQRYDVIMGNGKRKRRHEYSNLGHNNASVQANIDYTSEEDMRRKMNLLLRLAPFLSAMYANSPLKEGKNSGFVSYRTQIIQHADPKRYGIRQVFFSKDFSFADWIDFAMKVPMVAIFRDGHWMGVENLTFNQFMKSGYQGYAPIMDDWILQLSFIYTDVRIRGFMELRVCDSLPPFLIPSMQAIVKAFVYHKDGEKAIEEITKDWTYRDFLAAPLAIAKDGMYAEVRGRKLLDYCKEVLNVASHNLKSLAVLNEKGEDESVHLLPIKDFVFVKEKSPGRWVMENWDGEWERNPNRLIEWCSFQNSHHAHHGSV